MVLADRCEYDFDINFPAFIIGLLENCLINNAGENEKLAAMNGVRADGKWAGLNYTLCIFSRGLL